MRGILLLAVLWLAGCQHVAAPPVVGEIRDLRSGEHLTAQQLLARLSSPSQVIVGEQHDNADHHALQLWLLQNLEKARPQGSLLLEMLTPDQQSRVDDVRHASTPPADLPAALAWQDGWDWNLYGPIVRFALTQSWPLLAANLDNIEIRAFYRDPPVLSGERSNAKSVKETLLEQIGDSHCGLLPSSQMPACWPFSNSGIGAWPRVCWQRLRLPCYWRVRITRAKMSGCRCMCWIWARRKRRRC